MIECPHCHISNCYEKVHVLYQKELKVVSYERPLSHDFFGKVIYYGSETVSATKPTELARKFAPPERPFYYGMFISSEEEWWFSVLRVFFSFGVIAITISILGRYMLSVLNHALLNNKPIVTPLLLAFAFLLVSGILGRIYWELKKVLYIKSELTYWGKTYDLWNKLIYCANCDCIFVDGSEFTGNISNMKAYLAESVAMNDPLRKIFQQQHYGSTLSK